MLLIQIFLIIFFLFALWGVVLRYKAGDLSITGLLFWVLFWVMASVIVLIPNSSAYFAKIVGIGRGVDLVIYVSLVMLFFMIFKLNIKIEKINKDITKIVRTETLNEKE